MISSELTPSSDWKLDALYCFENCDIKSSSMRCGGPYAKRSFTPIPKLFWKLGTRMASGNGSHRTGARKAVSGRAITTCVYSTPVMLSRDLTNLPARQTE